MRDFLLFIGKGFFVCMVGIVVLIALFAGGGKFTVADHNKPTLPPPAPISSPQEIEFQQYVSIANTLRNNMKNPASFQLVKVVRMKPATLCITYRGTNSFNAVVPGQAVTVNNKTAISGNDDFVALWNKHCAGKSGDDWTSYIRPALL